MSSASYRARSTLVGRSRGACRIAATRAWRRQAIRRSGARARHDRPRAIDLRAVQVGHVRPCSSTTTERDAAPRGCSHSPRDPPSARRRVNGRASVAYGVAACKVGLDASAMATHRIERIASSPPVRNATTMRQHGCGPLVASVIQSAHAYGSCTTMRDPHSLWPPRNGSARRSHPLGRFFSGTTRWRARAVGQRRLSGALMSRTISRAATPTSGWSMKTPCTPSE